MLQRDSGNGIPFFLPGIWNLSDSARAEVPTGIRLDDPARPLTEKFSPAVRGKSKIRIFAV